jgi:Tol biopolymer transport system component
MILVNRTSHVARCYYIALLLIVGGVSHGCLGREYPEVRGASFSPRNDSIVFSCQSNGRRGIFLMQEDGTVVTQLVASEAETYDVHPVCSPDGSKIAFASNRGGERGDIYMMDAAGKNLRRLTTGEHHDLCPVFSPSGDRIYFLRSRYFGSYSYMAQPHLHEQDIFYVDVAKGSVHAVTTESFYMISPPSILPDSKHMIVGMFEFPVDDSIWLVPLSDPRKREPLRPNLEKFLPDISEKPWATQPVSYKHLGPPVASPDGKWLAFSWAGHYQGHFGHELYLMNIETRETQKLTDLRSMVYPMCFSKDSAKILFLTDPEHKPRNQQDHSSLWMYDGNDGSLTNIQIDFSDLAVDR